VWKLVLIWTLQPGLNGALFFLAKKKKAGVEDGKAAQQFAN